MSSSMKFVCFEDFVLKCGQKFEDYIPRPKWVKKGIIKQCFSNCYKEVRRNRDKLIYCEGYAYSGIIPVHHAWLIYENKVIDPTWCDFNDNKEYYGIKFSFDYMEKIAIETGYYGVIDNFVQNFPLLRGEHEPEMFLHKERERCCNFS